jgi:hypothetical protein
MGYVGRDLRAQSLLTRSVTRTHGIPTAQHYADRLAGLGHQFATGDATASWFVIVGDPP